MLAFISVSLIFSLATGRFHPGLYGQPGAHLDYLWSFLEMGLVGWISVIIGGCPFRQLIKAGEGDADAGLVVIGMFIGGSLAQSSGIAATAAGVFLYGKVSILQGFALIASASIFSGKEARRGALHAPISGIPSIYHKSSPVVVITSLPCLTPLTPINSYAICLITCTVPLITRTSKQL